MRGKGTETQATLRNRANAATQSRPLAKRTQIQATVLAAAAAACYFWSHAEERAAKTPNRNCARLPQPISQGNRERVHTSPRERTTKSEPKNNWKIRAKSSPRVITNLILICWKLYIFYWFHKSRASRPEHIRYVSKVRIKHTHTARLRRKSRAIFA